MSVGQLIGILSEQDPDATVYTYAGVAGEGGGVRTVATNADADNLYYRGDPPDGLYEALDDGRPVVVLYDYNR